jgi:hypothetical protein
MQKILTILSATLITAITVQTAVASDRHHVRKAQPATTTTQSLRDSNAAMWPSQPTAPDWSRYANGAMSAPAGR